MLLHLIAWGAEAHFLRRNVYDSARTRGSWMVASS